MQLDLIQTKRSPRLLLALENQELIPIAGVSLQWPNRSESAVFDLSFGGIAVSTTVVSLVSTTRIEKIKMNHTFDLKLKITGLKEALPVKLKVVYLSAKVIGFAFDTLSTSGRLVIEQTLKDSLISQNLHEASVTQLHPHLQADHWWHGPFDTNIFMWNEPRKVIVEYDNLVWTYDQGEISLVRSAAAVSEAQGYLPPQFGEVWPKMAMGNGWKARLVKLLKEAPHFSAKSEVLNVFL